MFNETKIDKNVTSKEHVNKQLKHLLDCAEIVSVNENELSIVLKALFNNVPQFHFK